MSTGAAIHFAVTGDTELIYKSVSTVVFLPDIIIEAKVVVLQHQHNENTDSYASLAAHQKIASIFTSTIPPL